MALSTRQEREEAREAAIRLLSAISAQAIADTAHIEDADRRYRATMHRECQLSADYLNRRPYSPNPYAKD